MFDLNIFQLDDITRSEEDSNVEENQNQNKEEELKDEEGAIKSVAKIEVEVSISTFNKIKQKLNLEILLSVSYLMKLYLKVSSLNTIRRYAFIDCC